MKKFMTRMTLLAAMIMSATIYSQDNSAAPVQPQQGYSSTFIMIAIAIVFFYFILWRPEQKKRKVIEQRRNAMKKGDKVTAMGIVGTVSKIEASTVILKMVDGSKIEVLKAAINEVVPEEDKTSEK